MFYILKIKNIFFYERRNVSKQILVTGGYGYKNVGDEAQLNATLQWLEVNFPGRRRIVLTHDRNYTYNEHSECMVYESPRESFFDHNDINIYSAANLPIKSIFLFNSLVIYLNSYLVRAGLPVFFINAKKAALLEELKNTEMLFYSGGGYLTGKTLSRLWDGILFIAIAQVFKVPVILSGQTIGIWEGRFNKYYAKWGLSKASVITTRDPIDSINALNSIGLNGDNVFVTFDDALLCEKIDNMKINEELLKIGLNNDEVENYITMNIHYWGIEKDDCAKKLLRKKVNSVVEFIVNDKNKKVVFIAMTPTDYIAIDEYMKEYPCEEVIKYEYEYDFRYVRGIISKSNFCITMKHHPIIFSMGEKIPVISLSNFPYYEHKNGGALKLFGLENNNLNFSDSFDLENFISTYENIEKNYESYVKDLDKKLKKIVNSKKKLADKCHQYMSV